MPCLTMVIVQPTPTRLLLGVWVTRKSSFACVLTVLWSPGLREAGRGVPSGASVLRGIRVPPGSKKPTVGSLCE
eukprot:608225-Amphidinium_carterae.1